MLLRNLGYLSQDPAGFLLFMALTVVALLVGLTVHEFSHALVASGMGDPTARRLGRLSLDPRVHLDPVGSLMLLLVGFGWGKPVPVNPLALAGSPLRGMAMVALAGPASNVVAAALVAIPFRLGLLHWPFTASGRLLSSGAELLVAELLALTIFYNLVLAVFNLIPVAPLDGSRAVLGAMPRGMALAYQRLEPWGPGILMGVILLDVAFGVGILGRVLGPAVNALSTLVAGHPLL